MLLYCGPIVFLKNGDLNPLSAESNGTFGLLDTGVKKLMVTCCHVWDGFWDYKQKNPAARMALLLGAGTPVLLPDKQPISSDRDMDLVVFDMEDLLVYTTKRRFFQIRNFPIQRARSKAIITFIGYPGAGKQLSESVGNFRYSSFGFSVTAVGDFAFTIQRGDSKRRLIDNAGRRVDDAELKGISGCPCYKLSRSQKLELVGFVKEGKTTDGSYFVAHASFIQPDGTLQR